MFSIVHRWVALIDREGTVHSSQHNSPQTDQWVSGFQGLKHRRVGVIRTRVEAWGVGFRQAKLRPQAVKSTNNMRFPTIRLRR